MIDLPLFDRCRIELRFSRETSLPFEHGGVLRGLFSRVLQRHDLPPGFVPFPCQSGHVSFQPGDRYAMGLTLAGSARSIAPELPDALERHGKAGRTGPGRGDSRPGSRGGRPPTLGGNYELAAFEWLDSPDLANEAEALIGLSKIRLCFLSPFRLQRPEEHKRRGAGYLDRHCFPAPYFLDRLWRRLFFLCHDRYPDNDERTAEAPPLPDSLEAHPEGLLWSDLPVRGARDKARPYTLGGVRGSLILALAEPGTLDHRWLEVLVAGSHLHAGSSTAYGCGRFALDQARDRKAPVAPVHDPLTRPANSLLHRVAQPGVLHAALDHVLEDRDEDDDPPASDLVDTLSHRLTAGTYQPGPLRGFVLPKDDGGVRPLAVPGLHDKVAQRAAVDVLAPALDTLLEEASFAYRRGFSRQGAARAIKAAYAEGYRFVLDADIRAFFDRVDWSILFAKLEALYPYEPLVELVRLWIQAPVVFDGRRIERRRGLPQGSSVSPLLANLYLDTFDEELLDAGFRLVRFADDFVVLAKDPEAASQAKAEVEDALARLRLELNLDETAIRSIDDGFSYLGYLFVRSLVLEEVGESEDAAPAAGPPILDTDAVPEGSWLAAVPLERIEALLAGRPERGAAAATPERVPLSRTPAEDPGRWPLYVTTHETRIFLRHDTVVVEPAKGERREIPLKALSHAVFVGRVRATVPVLLGLSRCGVPAFFCRASGELEATFGPYTPDSSLWLAQARAAEADSLRLTFASAVVEARLRNLAVILRRLDWHEAAKAATELRNLAGEVGKKSTFNALRGLEGRGTLLAFQSLAASLPAAWGFTARARRPPPDPVNAMLSFGYTLLHNHCITALAEAGLHPRLGLFHQPRGAHAALASDLMEELRHLVESLVWTLVRRRQIHPGDFRPSADGRFPSLLDTEARRTFIHAFEERLLTELTPEGDQEPLSYRAFLLRQARQIRELVRGERPTYEPLLLRR